MGDAPVVTDDRTYLDFTVPRSVESFYGISNNRYGWVDMSHARQVLGHVPQDSAEERLKV